MATFYARQLIAKRVIATAKPSVCLSVTCWYCTQKNGDRIVRSLLLNRLNANTLFMDANNGWGRRSLQPEICGQSTPL